MTDIPDRYSEDLDQYVEQVERDGLLSAPPWLKREILEAAGITADKEGGAGPEDMRLQGKTGVRPAGTTREERRRSFRQYTAEVIFAMAASLILLFFPSGITGTGRPENRDTAFFPEIPDFREDASGIPGGKTDFPDLFGEAGYNRYSLTAALDEGTRLVCGRIKEFSGVFFRDENYSAIGRED